MCGVARLGSASRDQATGLVVGGTRHNSSKGDTADPVVWSLFCPAWVIAAPSLRCSLAAAPIGAHLPSICCDPAGILPSTSGFPVVGVLVGLYASLQCCHQPINPPPGACRRAPKTTNNSSIAFQLYFAGKVPDL